MVNSAVLIGVVLRIPSRDVEDPHFFWQCSAKGIWISGDETKGNVQFRKKSGSGWSGTAPGVPYLKKESILGAIFASDIDMYNCGMSKAFNKLGVMAYILNTRSTYLKGYYTNDCKTPHQNAVTPVTGILPQMIAKSSGFPNVNVVDINVLTGDLKQENGVLNLKSCVLIY